MNAILAVGLLAPFLAVAPRDVSVYAFVDPTFGNDLKVVIERTGKDAKAIWDADDEELQEVRTKAGVVLEPSPFGVEFVGPGDIDPTRKGFNKIDEGRNLVVFEFRAPDEAVKSIPRFAGTYELLQGGEEHWLDLPFKKVADLAAWDDEVFEGSVFELERGVREVQVIHVRLSGEIFDVDEVAVFADDASKELDSGSSAGDLGSIEYSFDLTGGDPEKLTVRISLDDGAVVEIDDIQPRAKYKKVKSAELAKAKLTLEVRQTPMLEAFAEGKGSFDRLRGYRWVNKRGKPLEIWPESHSSGGGKNVTTACRIPVELPRGAKLQLGVLIGAAWETVPFEYEVKLKD